MELFTKRLLLVPLGSAFLISTHAYAGNPENTPFMRDLPSASLEDTARFLRKCDREWAKDIPGFYEFAVLKKDASSQKRTPSKMPDACDGCPQFESLPVNSHIGAISLYPDDARISAELGWMIRLEDQGHGYASEAVKAVLSFAVRELNIRHFIAHCDAENEVSWHFMEKLGMQRTQIHGGRRNKGSSEDRTEYVYELDL